MISLDFLAVVETRHEQVFDHSVPMAFGIFICINYNICTNVGDMYLYSDKNYIVKL